MLSIVETESGDNLEKIDEETIDDVTEDDLMEEGGVHDEGDAGEVEEEEDESPGPPLDWRVDPKSKESGRSGRRQPATKSELYATEEYRITEVPLGKFAEVDFSEDRQALLEAASMIVVDNFERYHLGLVIPLNASADYRGKNILVNILYAASLHLIKIKIYFDWGAT